jgi:hypothetical protein
MRAARVRYENRISVGELDRPRVRLAADKRRIKDITGCQFGATFGLSALQKNHLVSMSEQAPSVYKVISYHRLAEPAC